MRRMHEAHCAKHAWKMFRENNNLSIEKLTEMCGILDTFFDQSDEAITTAMEREFGTKQESQTVNSDNLAVFYVPDLYAAPLEQVDNGASDGFVLVRLERLLVNGIPMNQIATVYFYLTRDEGFKLGLHKAKYDTMFREAFFAWWRNNS